MKRRPGVERNRARSLEEIPFPREKVCSICKALKPKEAFGIKRAERDGLQSACRDCLRIVQARRYAADPAKAIAVVERWAKKNPDKVKKNARATYYRNHESRKARNQISHRKYRPARLAVQREYYERNKGALLEYFARYRATLDPEALREYHRNYRENNRDRMAFHINAYRIRKMNAPGTHTRQEWADQKLYFQCCCAYCLKPESECGRLARDHVLALTEGGSDDIENIVPSCHSCNSRKRSSSLLMFLQRSAA